MSQTRTVRTRHPKAVTRTNILQKGYEMYLDRRLEHGNERLSAVLDELGYTTGAGYQIWDNQAAFRKELNVFVAENIEYASLRNMAADIVGREAADLGFEQTVLQGGDAYATAFFGREEFYLTLRFFSMADDRPDEITEALRDAYVRLRWEAGELFQRTMARYGKKLKPGVDIEDLTTAVTALVEGYALRGRVNPEVLTKQITFGGHEHHVFSVGFLGLVQAYTE